MPEGGPDAPCVVDGEAVRVTEYGRLREPAAREVTRRPSWHVEVRDGRSRHGSGGCAFPMGPRVVFGFRPGEPFGRARWRSG